MAEGLPIPVPSLLTNGSLLQTAIPIREIGVLLICPPSWQLYFIWMDGIGYTDLISRKNAGTGSFPTSSIGNNFSQQFATGGTAGNIIYESNALYPQTVTIVVSRYNSITKVISGVFYGQVYDINDSTVNISNGKFKATVTSQ